MAEYKINKQPFRFWCQKILPLVYDDSLSYYELLCKVVDYLNKEMEDISTVTDEMEELQEYVSTYFDSLDVQSEINHKLDKMAENGTLGNIIAEYTDTVLDEFKTQVNSSLSTMNDRIDDQNTEIGEQNTNIANVTNAITALSSRMDEFTSLPDGSLSTVADAELVDIRTAYNGTVYNSAGTAVRTQVEEVNDIILDYVEAVYGNANINFSNTGYLLRQDNGNTTASTAWATCPYRSVGNAKALLLTAPTSANSTVVSNYACICFYSDANVASYIGCVPIQSGVLNGKKNIIVTVPDNANYFRVTTYAEQTSEYKLYFIGHIGDFSTDYISYNIGDSAELYSRNLIGMEKDKYYPVSIPSGENFTFSTYDRSVFPADSQVLLRMYDKYYNELMYTYLNSGLYYKVVTNTSASEIAYIRWITVHSKNVMLVHGNKPNDYIPYYSELKNRFTKVRKRILADTTISEDPIVITESVNGSMLYSLEVKTSHSRKFSVTANINGTWKPVKMVNIKTGKQTYAEYQHGEYMLLDTVNASSLRITLDSASTNYGELWLNEYGELPYIATPDINKKYLPELKNGTQVLMFRCFGVYGGYAYGIDDNRIRRCNLETLSVSTFHTAEYNISTAMIFDNGNILYVTAEGSENKMYLLSDGSVTVKHDFYNLDNDIRLTPNRLFSWFNYKNIGIVCEYYGAKTPTSGYKAFLTKDYGETWSTVFNLTDYITDPVASNAHLHSCVYDHYNKMYWACSGDAVTSDAIWYSVDEGEHWYTIQTPRISVKPTVIVPMNDCVLFISDSGAVNVYKWQRKPFKAGDELWLDTIEMFVPRWGSPCPIGSKGYHDAKNGIVYFGYDTDSTSDDVYDGNEIKYSDVFVTDGYNVQRVYKSDVLEGCLGLYGDEDHVVIAHRTNTIVYNK